MPEPVRLVIWDLDETFWRGTLTEGGIREYVRAHHDLIIELCRRGIMSSICSKYDFAKVKAILEREGIWEYFVFPSIDWSPKGARVASIIEAIQLRPASVLFIDDNPNNLAEARSITPDLQTASEKIISTIAERPLFKGKDDAKLSRLAQYKLLEKRKADELSAGGDNSEFLRGCEIKVEVETDIEKHLDRAIELINRTNQLNFTKRRLPDDPAQAREQLLDRLRRFQNQAGLIRVSDKYGDYGFCGFYLMSGVLRESKLEYFCFSCRILGMGVEHWLYDKIGRPSLTVVGEVLTDIHEDKAVDWINTAKFAGAGGKSGAGMPDVPKLALRGGCELDALGHYFRMHCPIVTTETNCISRGSFLKFNTSTNLVLGLNRHGEYSDAVRAELPQIGFAPADLASDLWTLPAGGVGVFCGWADLHAGRYRHKTLGFTLAFDINRVRRNLTEVTDEDIDLIRTTEKLSEIEGQEILDMTRHVRANYEFVPGGVPEDELRANMDAIFAAIPASATLFALLVHEKGVGSNPRRFFDRPTAPRYNMILREMASKYRNVRLIDVGKFIRSVDDCQLLVDHYTRTVYFSIYNEIVDSLRGASANAA
jgi:FkbH-like protein